MKSITGNTLNLITIFTGYWKIITLLDNSYLLIHDIDLREAKTELA